MTLETLLQVLAGGLLMGLIYALVAAGLSLIFGLMDVVNFAHGEFAVVAMYATHVVFQAFGLDPLFSLIPIAAAFFDATGKPARRIPLKPDHVKAMLTA